MEKKQTYFCTYTKALHTRIKCFCENTKALCKYGRHLEQRMKRYINKSRNFEQSSQTVC